MEAKKIPMWVKPRYLRRRNGVRRPEMEIGPLRSQQQGVLGPDRVWDVSYSLKEASLVLLLIVGPKLDLALEASKLTGLVEGDRVRAIQDVISCLDHTGKGGERFTWVKKCHSLCFYSHSLPPLPQESPLTPAHIEGSAVRGPGSPHSGLSRRTSSAAEVSHAPLLPVPSVCGHGPASSLGHRESPQSQAPKVPVLSGLWLLVYVFHLVPSLTNMLISVSIRLCFISDASLVSKTVSSKSRV